MRARKDRLPRIQAAEERKHVSISLFGFWRVRTPKLSISVNGAGDAIAALFFVHYARTRSAATALGEASASIYGLLKRTEEAGSREILTVAAQDEFVSPTRRFEVEEV